MQKPELIGGVEKREIFLSAPTPAWRERFAAERMTIRQALGEAALRIDHIGSTAVPRLPAKSIVDIDLSVADAEDEDGYLPALITAGYQLRVREPGHRLVRTPDLTVHVHICTTGSEWERSHLLFRDWLRHSEKDRASYYELKAALAAQPWDDMNAYADAKGPLIAQIMQRAESWSAAGHWSFN